MFPFIISIICHEPGVPDRAVVSPEGVEVGDCWRTAPHHRVPWVACTSRPASRSFLGPWLLGEARHPGLMGTGLRKPPHCLAGTATGQTPPAWGSSFFRGSLSWQLPFEFKLDFSCCPFAGGLAWCGVSSNEGLVPSLRQLHPTGQQLILGSGQFPNCT